MHNKIDLTLTREQHSQQRAENERNELLPPLSLSFYFFFLLFRKKIIRYAHLLCKRREGKGGSIDKDRAHVITGASAAEVAAASKQQQQKRGRSELFIPLLHQF